MNFIEKIKAYYSGKRAVAGMKDLALGVGIAGIVIAIMLLVLSNVQANRAFTTVTIVNATTGETSTAYSAGYNAVGTAITAVTSIASWLGIIVVVAIGAYVLQYLGVFNSAGKVGGK